MSSSPPPPLGQHRSLTRDRRVLFPHPISRKYCSCMCALIMRCGMYRTRYPASTIAHTHQRHVPHGMPCPGSGSVPHPIPLAAASPRRTSRDTPTRPCARDIRVTRRTRDTSRACAHPHAQDGGYQGLSGAIRGLVAALVPPAPSAAPPLRGASRPRQSRPPPVTGAAAPRHVPTALRACLIRAWPP